MTILLTPTIITLLKLNIDILAKSYKHEYKTQYKIISIINICIIV